MNLYAPTGKKLENWPQWVERLTKENQELRVDSLKLKQRCRELFKESEVLRRKVRELEKEIMEVKAESNG